MFEDFFSKKFNVFLVVALLLLGLALILQPEADSGFGGSNDVHFFSLPTCTHCGDQKEFNEILMVEFPDVNFFYHDVSTPDGARLFAEFTQKLSISPFGRVPTTVIGKNFFVGFDEKTSPEQLRAAIRGNLKNPAESGNSQSTFSFEIDLPFFGKTDLKNFSLPVLAIVLGLIDGFNPCAMWVLVYLIGIVLSLEDKKRTWLIVGSFLLASGILYFLFMTAWLNAFLILGYLRIVTLLVGLFALGGGILSLKDFFDSKGAVECKVVNPGERKSTMENIKELASSPLTFGTLGGIVALAFVVNSVEFVCSSALPAVFTQILALNNLSFFEYYGYILLYVLFFMLDDLIIFSLAAVAATSSFGEKYAKYCHVLGGALMLLIGLALLFAPNLLTAI